MVSNCGREVSAWAQPLRTANFAYAAACDRSASSIRIPASMPFVGTCDAFKLQPQWGIQILPKSYSLRCESDLLVGQIAVRQAGVTLLACPAVR